MDTLCLIGSACSGRGVLLCVCCVRLCSSLHPEQGSGGGGIRRWPGTEHAMLDTTVGVHDKVASGSEGVQNECVTGMKILSFMRG